MKGALYMKKTIIILIFAFILCLSSCIKIDVNVEKTSNDDTSKENVTVSIGGKAEGQNEEEVAEDTADPLPKDGLWYAVNDLTPDVEYFVIKEPQAINTTQKPEMKPSIHALPAKAQ